MKFSESDLNSLLDLPLGVVVASFEGEIVYANAFLCTLLGHSSADLEKLTFYDLVPSRNQDAFKQVNARLREKETKVRTVQQLQAKDGSVKSVLYQASNFRMRNGADCIAAAVTVLDEEMLEESVFLNAVINGFPDLIYFKNRQSQFLKLNLNYLKKFKIAHEDDILGKTDFDLFTEEHARQAYEDEQNIIETGIPLLNIEEKETYEDGRITWVSTSKMPLRNAKGEIIGTFGISRDITEAKEQETEIKLKTSILNAITSKMPVVIFKFVKDEGITSWFGNPELTQLFEKSKVIRLNIAEGLSHIVDKISYKDREGYINFSSNNTEASQETYFENYVFESDQRKDEYIGLALDITDRKNIEYKLKRDSKELEKTNRELSEFAYIVSHDLKAPLRAIFNLADWIEEDLEEIANDETKENLKLMKGRVQRMENLIAGILQYSRVGKDNSVQEAVNVKQLLQETIDSLAIPETFTVTMPEKLPVIMYSKMDLDRVFANLISNAVKYHDKSNGIIEVGYNEDEEYHIFSVSDDGPGIDSTYHEKIFKIFQTLQARDTKESTGIGLTIVKKIVEGRGGAVSVESEAGSGTKFIFTVPKEGEMI